MHHGVMNRILNRTEYMSFRLMRINKKISKSSQSHENRQNPNIIHDAALEKTMCKIPILTVLILLVFSNDPAAAQERTQTGQTDTQRESALFEVVGKYEKKIEELEARIKDIEEEKAKEESASELEKLLQEAQSLKSKKKEKTSINRVFKGSERFQPQMNPEISLTGDFYGSYTSSGEAAVIDPGAFTDGRNQFFLREAEFHIIAPLDPFTRGKFFLGIPGAGEESLSDMIGEAYMEWLNFPGNMNLKVGFFNTQFGILNRWHDHGLPQVDRPSALNNLFDGESLSGVGLSGNFLLPKLWAHVNELDIEVISGGDGFCFDSSHDNIMGVAHLKNYYDLTRNTYLEVGFSGAYGYNNKDSKLATTLAGVDLTCKWVPAGRSHYRTTEFRNELYFSRREGVQDNNNYFGFYSYVNNRMSARTWIGLRYSFSGMPAGPDSKNYIILDDENEWDISPTLDFWQSEFVMLRLQYSYTKRSYMDDDHSVFLQTVWSMGPHKHEAY